MITLVIEAATYAGSAAVIIGTRLLGERTVVMRGREHEALMPAVASLLEEHVKPPARIERIVCGAGPGSFTSLRIAGGIAKGLAMATGAPLVAVSSLALIVASQPSLAPGRYLAAIDALRGEHYVAPFDVTPEGEVVPSGPTILVASAHVGERAAELGAHAVGPGQPERSVEPHARGAVRLARLIDGTPAADLAGWEPAYGRLAEAQVRWEAEHGRPLAAG